MVGAELVGMRGPDRDTRVGSCGLAVSTLRRSATFGTRRCPHGATAGAGR
jgi:hypothetical protein